MDIMSFLPTFLEFIFKSGKKNKIRDFKKKTKPFKGIKQEKIFLSFENFNLIKIIDYTDVISCSFNDMELWVDKVKFFYSTNYNL